MPKIKLNDLDYGGSPTVEDADHLMVADTRNQTLSAQNIITNILGDMAQLEHNATASKAYAKGEYLVLGSYFYKATADIAQGDTLVAGTNIEQTNVGAEMNWRYVDTSSTSVNLPTGIQEILVIATHSENDHPKFSITIPYSAIPSEGIKLYNGFNNEYASATVGIKFLPNEVKTEFGVSQFSVYVR